MLRPRWFSQLVLAAICCSLGAMASPNGAFAGLDKTGRWTSKHDAHTRWIDLPVHMVLTRGYSGSHSQILWYRSDAEGPGPVDSLLGGVWAWNPATATADADCENYPYGSFTELSHGESGHNLFCSAHTVLPDGKVLIAGGSEPGGEVGVKYSVIFDPSTRNFTAQDTMAERRWYPTCTTLPNGKALVTSGSTYYHEWLFGGRPAPGATPALGASIRPFGKVANGLWDAEIRDLSSGAWPAPRSGHTAVYNETNNEMTIFGGLDTNGTGLRNDTWFMFRNNDTDAGAHYSATRVAAASTPSDLARFHHTAIVPGDKTVVLFGGQNDSVAYNDVYQLREPVPFTWEWQHPTVSGTAPTAREGHGAVWDPENQRMLVFGGTRLTSGLDQTPQDNALYGLTGSGTTWSWSTLTVDSDSVAGYPSPRHGHAMVLDTWNPNLIAAGAPADRKRRAFLFGGSRGGSATGIHADSLRNDLWVLWIPRAGSSANYKWQKVEPTGTPPTPRMRCAMFVDEINNQLVISGGTISDTAATAATVAVVLDHLTSANDRSWAAMPDYPLGPVTGHTASADGPNWAFGQEVFDPAFGTWAAQGTRRRQDWYPFGFVTPQTDSMRVFYAGPDTVSCYYNLSGSSPHWGPCVRNPVEDPGYRSGSAVMYLPGKVMRCGSRDTDAQGSAAVGTTQIVDLQSFPPPSTWTATASMANRVNHNLVILPTGTVLAVGGTDSVSNSENFGPVFRPQMWRPATATWTPMTGPDTLAADSTIRGYHSNAILLPDGRVLSVSGNPTHDDSTSQAYQDAIRATIYCPPYLFNASGNLKPRAVISASVVTDYNTTFTACVDNAGTPPGIQSLCLIRPAASTHAFNMDQRFIPLSFQSQCRGRQLVVTAPANSSVAPPGDYMLFAVTTDSMPSIAQWIRLGIPDEDPPTCLNCGGSGGAMIAGGSTSGGESGTTARLGTQATTAAVTSAIPGSENALLVEASGERLYQLRSDPSAGGEAVIRIQQDSGGETTLDAATLTVVDHPSSTTAYAAGDHILVGRETSVAALSSGKGSAVASLTSSSSDAVPWVASEGDTLGVDLSPNGSAVLRIVARRGTRDLFGSAVSPDVYVLAADAEGTEVPIAKVEPRLAFDDIIVEKCPARVRIAAGPGTQVQRIVQVTADSSTAGSALKLVDARSSGAPNAIEAMATAGSGFVTIAAGDTASLRWSLPATLAEGQVRSFFLRALSTTVSTDSSHALASQNAAISPAYVFALSGARPNPFVGTTTVNFSLAQSGHASLKLYDVAGRLVRTLVDGMRPAGPASASWDGRDNRGAKVGGGVYFARLNSGANQSNRKLILLGW